MSATVGHTSAVSTKGMSSRGFMTTGIPKITGSLMFMMLGTRAILLVRLDPLVKDRQGAAQVGVVAMDAWHHAGMLHR